jgi:hypothetical protein
LGDIHSSTKSKPNQFCTASSRCCHAMAWWWHRLPKLLHCYGVGCPIGWQATNLRHALHRSVADPPAILSADDLNCGNPSHVIQATKLQSSHVSHSSARTLDRSLAIQVHDCLFQSPVEAKATQCGTLASSEVRILQAFRSRSGIQLHLSRARIDRNPDAGITGDGNNRKSLPLQRWRSGLIVGADRLDAAGHRGPLTQEPLARLFNHLSEAVHLP